MYLTYFISTVIKNVFLGNSLELQTKKSSAHRPNNNCQNIDAKRPSTKTLFNLNSIGTLNTQLSNIDAKRPNAKILSNLKFHSENHIPLIELNTKFPT